MALGTQISGKPSNGVLTHREIAEKLGVSRQLVGFALRGEGRVSEEMRRQILEVAQSNGYNQYSNREARMMASKRYGKRAASGIMAVVFQATFEAEPVTGLPFFTSFFEGLESEAIARGFDLALCALRPHDLPRLVRDCQVDGVIGLLTPQTLSQGVSDLGLPVINIMYAAPDAINLVIDEMAATSLATQHLFDLGHRKIAYIGVDTAPGKARLSGFDAALRQNSVERESQFVEIATAAASLSTGAEAMKQLLEKNKPYKNTPGFSGLVCYNDLLAMGAIQTLQENGYCVPEDVSVVGFDDISCQYSFQPSLTSIGFPRAAMGRRAIEILNQISDGTKLDSHEKQTEVFPVELVVRDSTQPCQF